MRYTLFLLLFCGCSLVAPINPDWVKPIDPPLPLECETYEPVTTPVFSSFHINLDVAQTNPVFYLNGQPINNFYETIYQSGQNIGGISSANYGSNRIYCIDGGAKHYLQFISQGMNFRGALTFDQYWNELQTHRSAQFIRFTNTGYTCEQIIQVLNFFLEGCFETPDYVDLRPISIGTCEIPTEIIAEYELRGSVVAQ
jgi:hypothetical protein